jgi:hypothetical protein
VKASERKRQRLTRDGAWMRRLRRKYLRRCAAWLEADRERIYELCAKMQARGLYAPTTCECDVRSGAISTLGKTYGYDSTKLRNQWLLKSGWSAFWGYYATKYRRARDTARESRSA